MEEFSVNRQVNGLIIAAITFFFLGSNLVFASDNHDEKINEASLVLTEIMRIPESRIPPALLGRAYGVAVIPRVIKAGLVLGGRYGRGILVIRPGEGGWTNPSFIKLSGGGAGFQVGVQSTDIILVFKHRRSYDFFLKGKFTMGADASVAAGPVGRHTEAATDLQLRAEIYSYSRSRGLFAGVSLEGTAIQIDTGANAEYYGKPYVTVDQIFSGKVEGRYSSERFRGLLEKYAK